MESRATPASLQRAPRSQVLVLADVFGATPCNVAQRLASSVEGAQVGDTLTLPSGGGTIEVEAVADSIFPIHTLEIVQNTRAVDPAYSDTQCSLGARERQ